MKTLLDDEFIETIFPSFHLVSLKLLVGEEELLIDVETTQSFNVVF